jgi:hypothetical protein
MNSSNCSCRLEKLTKQILTLLYLCATLPLAAQQTTKLPQITTQDPELYYAFFRAHMDTDQKIQTATPAAAASLAASTASTYHISAADLPKFTAEIRKLNASLGALYATQQNYLYQQKVAKKMPDMKVLAKNQWQRQRLVMNTHGAVHKALTKASWDGLYGYINGDFKANLTAGKGAGK